MNVIMRMRYWLMVFFLFCQVDLFSQECVHNLKTSSNVLVEECSIYNIISSGVESEIRNYFKNVTTDELNDYCCSRIVGAFNTLGAKEKVSHTVWVLEEVKNRPSDIRSKMYSTLLRVNYAKSTFLLKPMINSYFTNYTEPDDSLAPQVYLLQRRMIK